MTTGTTMGVTLVMARSAHVAALLLVAWMLAACAVPAPRGGMPVEAVVVVDPVEPVPTPLPAPAEEEQPPPAVPPEPAPTASAALALAAQSEQSLAAGDLRLAGLQLERALRIAPRDPQLWSRLAQVRLQQGDDQQAERMAERSLQLGTANRTLTLANWRIIATARERMGDTEGARRAHEEIQRLERSVG